MVESVQTQGVWHYDDWERWCAAFDPWLDARFDRDVLKRFTADAQPTWLEWLDNEQLVLTGRACSVSLFRSALKQRFPSIRLYHATRLSRLADLHEHGLRAWSPQELRNLARQTFAGSEAESARLERAIAQANPEHTGGRVYTFRLLQDALAGGGAAALRELGRSFSTRLRNTWSMPAT